MSKRALSIVVMGLVVSLLSSCGYHLGGLKAKNMENMNSFAVRMFENNSLEAQAGILVTNAVTDTIQRDGTYKLASYADADFRIEGCIESIGFESLSINTQDTYISTELAIVLNISYKVVDNNTSETIFESRVETEASFFNQLGNIQTARENALSYAASKAAEELALSISTQ